MGNAVSTRERERDNLHVRDYLTLFLSMCLLTSVCVCLIIFVFVCLIDLVTNKDSVFDWHDFLCISLRLLTHRS